MNKLTLRKEIYRLKSIRLCSIILINFLMLGFSAPNLHAQLEGKPKLDSLLLELPKAKEDSNKIKLLRKLANVYKQDNYKQALAYARQMVELSEKLHLNKFISTSYYFLGNLYLNHSDFVHGLECLQKALKIEQGGGDKESMASVLNNMAVAYMNMSEYAKAIDANLKALQLFEEIKNLRGMANCHLNISGVCNLNNKMDKALEHLQTALKIYTEMSDKHGIALSLNNIGVIQMKTKDSVIAKDAFVKALAIYQEIQDIEGIDMAMINVAQSYIKTREYTKALEYGFKALQTSRTHDMTEGLAFDYNAISEIYYNMATNGKKDPLPVANTATALKLASHYSDSALAIYKTLGMLEEYADAVELSSRIHMASGNYKEAYEGYKLYKTLNDSVFNIEKDKKITQSSMQYEFDKKEAAIKAEQEKKNIRQRNIRNSIIAGLMGSLVFLVVVYRQRNRISKEKARSEELLLNILPEEVAEELKEKGSADAKHFAEVTVMFTDFKDFTKISEKLTPTELVAEIHECFKAFDLIISQYNIEKIKTIGDSYMCAGGLPVTNTTNALDVVKAALEIQQFMHQYARQRKEENKESFEIRIGIHTGPVVAGIVGVKKFAYDIWGDTVNTASRVESSGEAGKVNISGTTYTIVKDLFNFTYRGKVHAKGKGEVDMYFVEGMK